MSETEHVVEAVDWKTWEGGVLVALYCFLYREAQFYADGAGEGRVPHEDVDMQLFRGGFTRDQIKAGLKHLYDGGYIATSRLTEGGNPYRVWRLLTPKYQQPWEGQSMPDYSPESPNRWVVWCYWDLIRRGVPEESCKAMIQGSSKLYGHIPAPKPGKIRDSMAPLNPEEEEEEDRLDRVAEIGG